MIVRVLSLWERMAEGQVRASFDISRAGPHPSATKSVALCPLPKGEGLLHPFVYFFKLAWIARNSGVVSVF
jgi:hypothetical protein